MKPVLQTLFGEEGNCFNACLASIMELPLESVPPFHKMGTQWYRAFLEFLHENGYEYLGVIIGEEKIQKLRAGGVDGYYIVGGDSPRGVRVGHNVIYKDGKLAHDPHPDGGGLLRACEAHRIERKKLIPPAGEVRLIYGQPREKGFIGKVMRDGKMIFKLACPDCGEIGDLEDHRVLIDADLVTVQPSVVCDCGFHAFIEANKIRRV